MLLATTQDSEECYLNIIKVLWLKRKKKMYFWWSLCTLLLCQVSYNRRFRSLLLYSYDIFRAVCFLIFQKSNKITTVQTTIKDSENYIYTVVTWTKLKLSGWKWKEKCKPITAEKQFISCLKMWLRNLCMDKFGPTKSSVFAGFFGCMTAECKRHARISISGPEKTRQRPLISWQQPTGLELARSNQTDNTTNVGMVRVQSLKGVVWFHQCDTNIQASC